MELEHNLPSPQKSINRKNPNELSQKVLLTYTNPLATDFVLTANYHRLFNLSSRDYESMF
uniref:Uncharacterized protein n=1 Tax=Megaselia scalaris TaxID=36166 RepID=T1GW45_MEGSC